MKTFTQLLRQLVKSAMGILLVAAAVMTLISGVGQQVSTQSTRKSIEYQYDTVALFNKKDFGVQTDMSAEELEWLNQSAAGHPDIIKSISNSWLFTGYSPDISPINYTTIKNPPFSVNSLVNYASDEETLYQFDALSCAMLEITILEIDENTAESRKFITVTDVDGSQSELGETYYVKKHCLGRVESVICLQEGYASPIGRDIYLDITAPTMEDLEAMELEVGGRYLIYTEEYIDLDWVLRQRISEDDNNFRLPFDKSKVYTSHPYGLDTVDSNGTVYNYYENTVGDEKVYKAFASASLYMADSCAATVCDYSELPWMPMGFDEYGALAGYQRITDCKPDFVHYNPNDSQNMDISEEGAEVIPQSEYEQYYSVPTIAKLTEGQSAEEFLSSKKGVEWSEKLSDMDINNHALPLIAVDKIGYQADFAREQARIVEGRDFSEKELSDGSRVAIISQSLAAANNISVGDTIDLSSYSYDYNIPHDRSLREMYTFSFPHTALYSKRFGFETDAQKFEVVGLYRGENEWANSESSYGFTPNTVFIPKSAVSSAKRYFTRNGGMFLSVVLQNGKADEFLELAKEAGLSAEFTTFDRGYSGITEALESYMRVSSKAAYVGAAAFVVITVLFLALFVFTRAKTVSVMNALGARTKDKLSYVFLSGMGLALPGCVLGCAVSVAAWDNITRKLMEINSVSVEINSSPAGMCAALALIGAAVIAVGVIACAGAVVGKKR